MGREKEIGNRKNRNHVRVYYTNANGLIHKLPELKVILDEKDVDIVCVTESHYHDELLEAEITLPDYNAFRGDRNFKLDRSNRNADECCDGGGSVIYVKHSIKVLENSHSSILDSSW